MSVTAAAVGTELGVASPTPIQLAQWESWINQALYLIERRYPDLEGLDPEDVDYVVLQAVVAHATNPKNATQVDVSVDDGSVSKRYASGFGRVTITDDLWGILDPEDDAEPTGAFSIRPAYAPDRPAWY